MTFEDRARLAWITTRGYRVRGHRGLWAVLDANGQVLGPWRSTYARAIDAAMTRTP